MNNFMHCFLPRKHCLTDEEDMTDLEHHACARGAEGADDECAEGGLDAPAQVRVVQTQVRHLVHDALGLRHVFQEVAEFVALLTTTGAAAAGADFG